MRWKWGFWRHFLLGVPSFHRKQKSLSRLSAGRGKGETEGKGRTIFGLVAGVWA